MPGGRIPNQGKQPQAPGIGRDAKRHDLEAGATPGLGGPQKGPTDLQQGDVQELERGSQIVNQATQQPPAQGGGAPSRAAPAQPGPQVENPDPLEFIAKKGAVAPPADKLDLSKWIPLLREMASNPSTSGPLSAALIGQLSNYANSPGAGNVRIVDENAIHEAAEASFSG